jgi:carbon-monoxide dehydrogenase medium subunit
MASFDYLEPGSLQDACALLDQHGDDARLIAGGTALIIWMRQRLLNPKIVISLAKVPNLTSVSFDNVEGLRIGAAACHRDIELAPDVRRHYPLLHETFRKVAQPRIRNMGTIGGNLCQGDPLTDPGASLLALDAQVTVTGSEGKRTLPLEDFFVDYYETALQPGEILTEVHVPPPKKAIRWGHIKFTPRSLEDFATVGVALAIETEDNLCRDIRLALNSAGPKIFRAKKAEEVIRGHRVTEKLMADAAEIASTEAEPIDDIRGSAEYKREMVKVMVRRAIQQALSDRIQ